MAHEPILILDNDPVSQGQLTEILHKGGYDVYGVKAADRLLEAVQASPFPVIIMDVWIPNIDRVALIRAIHEVSPYTAVIFIGEKPVVPWLLQIFRNGAADFISKPFDPIELRQCVDDAVEKREKRLQRVEDRGSSSGMGRSGGSSSRKTRDLLKRTREFQDRSLEIFLELERRNLFLEKKIAALEHPSKNIILERKLVVMVADTNSELSNDLVTGLQYVRVEVAEQAHTGGEVLDRMGEMMVDILVVGRDLPDIPGEIVADSVKSQYPNCEVLLLENFGTNSASAIIVGPLSVQDSPRPVPSNQALSDLIQERVNRQRDKEEAKKIAQRFKSRHQDFLRALADIRKRIDKAIK